MIVQPVVVSPNVDDTSLVNFQLIAIFCDFIEILPAVGINTTFTSFPPKNKKYNKMQINLKTMSHSSAINLKQKLS